MAADWALIPLSFSRAVFTLPLGTWYILVPPGKTQLEGEGRDPGLGWVYKLKRYRDPDRWGHWCRCTPSPKAQDGV